MRKVIVSQGTAFTVFKPLLADLVASDVEIPDLLRYTFGIPTNELLRGVTPFIIVLFIFLALLIAFPQLILWLPNMMKG